MPSGTLWATCNVGATSPEDYGNYYAWGETLPKSNYSSSNYYYSNNPSSLPLNKDVANINWGEDWRMPTPEEMKELYSNYCYWTQTSENGILGYKITSKVNGNSIFLPITRDGGTYKYAYYWSSTRYVNSYEAWHLEFQIHSSNSYYNSWNIDNDERYNAYPIRPVLR